MMNGEPVVINGDGEQTRDFVYVGDCAQANLLAITGSYSDGIFNIGSGRGASVNEIFEVLKKITGYKHPAQYGPAKLGETRHIYLEASRARNLLGWSQTIGLEEGLEKTVAYFNTVEQPA
jgi:UDP-glucose 4-epimerase